MRPALVTTTTATLLRHPTPAPHHPAPGPSLAPIVVTQRYPSPSPIPHIWQPRGAVFTPKPFVHIHTSVQPVVTVTTTRAPAHYASSPAPTPPPQFTTPHPHFFTTPYPQTPYPPLGPRTRPRPAPAYHLPARLPYNGHAFPAHVQLRRHGAESRGSVAVVPPPGDSTGSRDEAAS